jgi:hypothetical protein
MGVKLINLNAGEKVISIAKISEDQIVYESTDGEEDLGTEEVGTEMEEAYEEDLNE